MSDHTWYTDTRDPGAPRKGDLVVPAGISARWCREIGHPLTPWTLVSAGAFWALSNAKRTIVVSCVRWPTESELAGYQLGAGSPGVQP